MDAGGPGRFDTPAGETSILDLLGRLASDGVRLLKEEGQLATLQLREVLLSTIWSTVRLAIPLGLAAIAALLLVVGAVAWLAYRLGSLWAGALVAGGGLLLVALIMLWIAARALGRQTRRSLAAPPEIPAGRKDDADEGPRLVTDGAPARP
jgi:hypothetical protein